MNLNYLPIFVLAVSLTFSAYAGEGHDHGDHEHDHGEHAHAETAVEEQAHDDHDHSGHDHADHVDHDDHAAHGHDQGHHHAKIIPGPNGGRVLTKVEPHLEFLVKDDRSVQISALDDDAQVIPVTDQEVKVYTGERSNPTRLMFAAQDGVLVSNVVVPEGDNLPVVVRIKTSDGGKVTEKFNLDLSPCPGCSHKEYACICEHRH